MVRFLKFLVSLLPYIFVFISSLYLLRDPDLGWHLRYGEYFFEHGQILKENIFSSMMPGYLWANGSWGTDIITYGIYNFGGFFGLILASAGIVTATFFFFSKAAKLSILEQALFFPLLAYFTWGINVSSFRGQQISLLLLGILFFLISRYVAFSKRLWLIPILFFVWVNLQTESFLGLILFGMWAVITMTNVALQEGKILAKENTYLAKIVIVSLLVTFLNPFGWGIHAVAFSHFGDPMLKFVKEYIPFAPYSALWWNQVIGLGVLIGAGIVLFSKQKLRDFLPWLLPTLILFLLSFEVRRFAWPAYYLLLPFLHVLWQLGEKYSTKYAFYLAYLISIISIIWVGYTKFPLQKFSEMSWDVYCKTNDTFCSLKSAQFLSDNNLTKNIFTMYDWGGFLIWNYPEIKPSVDGRMHLWRDKNGYSAVAEYSEYTHGIKKIDESPYDVVYLRMDKTIALYQELKELTQKKKWKLVYNDRWSAVLVRVKK